MNNSCVSNRNKTRRLIVIKDTDLDMSKLDASEVHYFETHTYTERENPKFWKLLENNLPKQRLGAQIRHLEHLALERHRLNAL